LARKLLGLIAFISTGVGLLISTIIKDMNLLNIVFIGIIGYFFAISVVEHFNDLKS